MQHPFASLSPAAARRQMVSAAALALLLASSPAAAALPNADDDRDAFFVEAGRAACGAPTPVSTTGPNILLVGDSISMGGSGYSLFVQDMMQTGSGGTLVGSLQHGGGFGGGGQMASSRNGAAKVAACMGNATGAMKPKAWSVVTYNAGLHDCDTKERVHTDEYTANLRAIFQTLKAGAHAVAFVTTTPYDMPLSNGKPPLPAGINMSCVVEYNVIARQVAQEVGGIAINDLYGYVEDFCQFFPKDAAGSGFGGNYTSCAVQTTGLHFFNTAPAPSGQQYTGISVARAAMRLIPEAQISNATAASAAEAEPPALGAPSSTAVKCGDRPAPLSKTLPNVLVIGDSISEKGSGYGPALENILELPGRPWRNNSGALASVQHNGGAGDNQAGPTRQGVICIDTWLGEGNKWDVITMNFGIHDCCPSNKNEYSDKADYIKNLDAIYAKASASLAPGGKLVWVSTTPHAHEGQDCGITGEAFDTCIDDYNAAALALLGTKPDVVVADLNAAVNAVCGKGYATCNLQRWHNVHFTDAGKTFCALEVAHAVAPLLAPKWLALTPKSL